MPLPEESLPNFRYHPDPLDTGSVERSDEPCLVCERRRGHVYTGPIYTAHEVEGRVCPWCVADGSAARALEASFCDEAAIGGGGWDKVSALVIDEVAHRTPGFSGFQQERWWSHCSDAAEFLGPAGRTELTTRWPRAAKELAEAAGVDDPEEWQAIVAGLSRSHGPTAFLFRCRRCKRFGGYIDST